jgi:hypothetical protein
MAVYPTPGGSDGTWGAETSAFHAVTKDLATGKVINEALQVADTAPIADAALANKKYVDDQIPASPGTAKAWAKVNSNGTLSEGFNATSVRTGTGTYTITFGTDFANNTYVALVTPADSNKATSTSTYAVGSVRVNVTTLSNVASDSNFSVVAFGTQ